MRAKDRKSSNALTSALRLWRQAIGSEYVMAEPGPVADLTRTTFAGEKKVLAVLFPASTAEVRKCVKIAARHLIPIYPVSSGKNWGYGSAAPVKSGSVVLHLRRLDRIVEINEELAYVTLEAGVTQRQLSDALSQKTQGRLWMDSTAACTVSSIVGNTMERGHGTTPYCDHVAKSCGYEVVLADGSVIQTGYAAFPNSKTGALDRWGPGPSLDGLFSQSNLGIVTRMSVFLMPAVEFVQAVFFAMSDERQFAAAVDAIRKLRLDGTVRCGPHFGNVYTSLLRVMSYPWELTGGKTPLKPAIAMKLAADYGISAWNGVIGLYGTESEVALAREKVNAALAPIGAKISHYDCNTDTSEFPQKRKEDMNRLYDALKGGVGGVALPRTYWRMKERPPEDPSQIDMDRDRVGCIYTGATAPFTGRDARAVSEIISKVFLSHGYEPIIGIYPIRDRTLNFHICLSYDRTVKGEDRRADLCQKELNRSLQKAGYYPHRLGIQNMEVMDQASREYRRTLAQLKDALDPHRIIAPGRYGLD